QAITQATARTTDGKTIDVTANHTIAPYQAQNFYAQRDACIASVEVRFRDGRSLSGNFNECRNPRIVVTDTNIVTATAASASPPANSTSAARNNAPLPGLQPRR
ncbi:MAG: hypothetical protein JO326_12410, partial [Acetobacteraceae bacterium]|nr:hypothetical protein [Acetobacteraceae bacterium]